MMKFAGEISVKAAKAVGAFVKARWDAIIAPDLYREGRKVELIKQKLSVLKELSDLNHSDIESRLKEYKALSIDAPEIVEMLRERIAAGDDPISILESQLGSGNVLDVKWDGPQPDPGKPQRNLPDGRAEPPPDE